MNLLTIVCLWLIIVIGSIYILSNIVLMFNDRRVHAKTTCVRLSDTEVRAVLPPQMAEHLTGHLHVFRGHHRGSRHFTTRP